MSDSLRSAGHTYGDVHISGNARALLGNNINNAEKSYEDRVLESLYFPGMEGYKHRDLEAFPGTYGWVFDENVTKFSRWLKSPDKLFWINGKPGAGKSCLMKFIFEHASTKALLSHWRSGNVFVIAFFFWKGGSSLEKSQLGLLRSMLYHILADHQELIKAYVRAPEKSMSRHMFPREQMWTYSYTLSVLSTILGAEEIMSSFCLLIDGLDESEDLPFQVIDTISGILKFSNVKIYVSSPPDNAFRTAYGARPCFAVQDLTGDDIDQLIQSQLEDNASFRQHLQSPAGASRVGEVIRTRAEGVFLWVKLALRSLRDGLDDFDDLATLLKRLDEMPAELEDFLEDIPASIKPVHRKVARRLLVWMVEWQGKHRLANYYYRFPLLWVPFLEDDLKNPEFYLAKRSTMTEEEYLNKVCERLDYADKCTNKWSRSLLETSTPEKLGATEYSRDCALRGSEFKPYDSTCMVRIAHRMIHDMLKAKFNMLIEWAGADFNIGLTQMRVVLAAIQCVPTEPWSISRLSIYAQLLPTDLIEFLMQSSKQLELSGSDLAYARAISMLKELDHVFGNFQGNFHWTAGLCVERTRAVHLSARLSDVKPLNLLTESSLILVAAHFGMNTFVRQELSADTQLLGKSGYLELLFECSLGVYYPFSIYHRLISADLRNPELDRVFDELIQTGLSNWRSRSITFPSTLDNFRQLALCMELLDKGCNINMPLKREMLSCELSIWQRLYTNLACILKFAHEEQDLKLLTIFVGMMLAAGADPDAQVPSQPLPLSHILASMTTWFIDLQTTVVPEGMVCVRSRFEIPGDLMVPDRDDPRLRWRLPPSPNAAKELESLKKCCAKILELFDEAAERKARARIDEVDEGPAPNQIEAPTAEARSGEEPTGVVVEAGVKRRQRSPEQQEQDGILKKLRQGFQDWWHR